MPIPVFFLFVLFLSIGSSTLISNDKCPSTNTCGWELMELGVPISYLGEQYAYQTQNRSLCVPIAQGGSPGGKEYCTCVFECGNGVWSCSDGVYRFMSGCKKYCHSGECDSDGA